jgi:uncharacterized protein YlxP (DUF503 family)
MVVGVIRLDLRFHHIHSLKEKRSLVSRLLSRERRNFPVSLAEVDLLDLYQRAVFGAAMVAGNEASIRRVLAAIEVDLERDGSCEIVAVESEFFHYGDMDS